MPILDRLQDPADLRGLTEPELVQLAAEIRETIIRTVAATGGHLGLVARRRRDHPRAAPAARVAARQDRVGHRAPGVRAQAADRPPGPVPHAAPDRRRRRVPAPRGVAARRDGRRPRRRRACRSPRASPPPATSATRWSGSRSSWATRRCCPGSRSRRSTTSATARPAADRAQRQRDVDQPVGRGAVQVPLGDQALDRVAAEQGRLGPVTEQIPVVGPRLVELSRRFRQSVVLVRPAGPAVRGPGHHVHRRHARPRPARCSRRRSAGRSRSTARSSSTSAPRRGRATARRDRPGLVPRRGAAADDPRPRDRRARPPRRRGQRRRDGLDRRGGRLVRSPRRATPTRARRRRRR